MESGFNQAYRMARERNANAAFKRAIEEEQLKEQVIEPPKSPLNIGINLRKKLVETRRANFERRVANYLAGMGINGRNDYYAIHNWKKEFGENPITIAEMSAQHNINFNRKEAVQTRRRRQINAMPKKPGLFNRLFGRSGGSAKKHHDRRRTRR